VINLTSKEDTLQGYQHLNWHAKACNSQKHNLFKELIVSKEIGENLIRSEYNLHHSPNLQKAMKVTNVITNERSECIEE
jgi:hypothetical protein